MKKRDRPDASPRPARREDPGRSTGKTRWIRGAVFLSAVAAVVFGAWALIKARSKDSDSLAGYTPRPRGTLTFAKDIAPVVFKQCAGCHRPGQSAPFSLLRYQDVRKHARPIAEVTRKRYMPPWLAEAAVGEFDNDRRLSADQIGMIQQWVSEGMAEGAPSDLPPTPQWVEGWHLGKPDLVIRLPRPYTLPADGKDVYRNFVIPIPTEIQRYVRAVEFLPDNPKIIHHAFMKIDRTPASRRLEAQESEPGFSFMITPDSAQMPEGHFLSWTPGSAASPEPEGLAWTLEKETDLVLQMHMRPTGKPETVHPSVGFYFTDTPPTHAPFKILLTSRAIDIPAGAACYVIRDTFPLPVDIKVLAVLPHAHYLGKELEGVATLPDGTKKRLIRIKDWDFNWQGDYRYAVPISLPKGTVLSMQYTYDNSTNNVRNPHHPPRRVTYGPQTTDEMAELWLQVLLRDQSDLAALIQAFRLKMLNVFLEQNECALRIKPDDAPAQNNLAKALLGLGRGREAIQHFRAAAQLQPDLEEPHFYLGYLFRGERRLPEAQAEYESVLRINPTNHQAHGNLGLVFLQMGDLEQAKFHFQSALRINPSDAVARTNLDFVLKAETRRSRRN